MLVNISGRGVEGEQKVIKNSLPCDFIIQIGDNSYLSIVPWDCENRRVGVFTVFQSILINELLVDTLRILRVFHIIQNLLTFNIIIHDVFKKISIDFQTFDMIWVDLPKLIELFPDLLYSLSDLRTHVLNFLDFWIFLEELLPKVQMQVYTLVNSCLEVHELSPNKKRLKITKNNQWMISKRTVPLCKLLLLSFERGQSYWHQHSLCLLFFHRVLWFQVRFDLQTFMAKYNWIGFH